MQSKFKILFIIASLSGGGAERVMINLLKHLDREKYKLSLALLNMGGEYSNELPADVELIKLKDYQGRRYFFHRIFNLRKVIRKNKPDLVVSFMTGSNISLTRYKFFMHRNLKLIIREGTNPSMSLSKKVNSRWQSFKKIEIKSFYKLANQIIVISNGIKVDLIKQWRFDSSLIKRIYNPLDVNEIQRKSLIPTSVTNSIKPDVRIIVAVGRFEPPKGYQDMIKSFDIIRKKQNVRLIILGKGPLESSIKKLISDLDLKDHVLMPGFVSNPWSYLNLADVYLSTSHWEGFHLTIAEAMACGVPPVATDCDFGPREVIQDGINGFLVPVGDIETIAEKVINLLTNEPLRKKLSENAKIRALDFDVSKIVKQYEVVFDKVISKHSA